MKEIDLIISELKKFSTRMLDLKAPSDPVLVSFFELKFNVLLPSDYKYLLSITNGFSLFGDEVMGVILDQKAADLFSTYEYEHFNVELPQPKHIIPFSPDGRGNFYCFDSKQSTNAGMSNAIIFWSSNYPYTEADQPEKTHDSLSDFIQECIIDWTLENYDYDGYNKI